MKLGRLRVALVLISCWCVREAFAQERPGNSRISLRPTFRLPGASADVEVSIDGGGARIEAVLDDLKPAALFGGDYNTYVFWAVLAGERLKNLGELFLIGDQSEFSGGTDASLLKLFITAEPHSLVGRPSSFVVMEDPSGMEGIRLGESGPYNYERDTLEGAPEAGREVRTEVRQAWTAVRLARRAGAAEFAKVEMVEAERALDATIALVERREDQQIVDEHARQTLCLANVAQNLAETRASLAAPDSSRKVWEEEATHTASAVREADPESTCEIASGEIASGMPHVPVPAPAARAGHAGNSCLVRPR